ncbi:cytochrome bc1 complex cytochrome b subunit [Naasia aerilata]|uniref:Cytochrome bc1 complex cytochrome b subunit n=1 Tax=Naasia aerilata TaxID=1162966 RepID=A0ABN6XN11_9MICO|nr:cytochrome bc1 complex cytochrome b subunit [Naasia aerilata]
MSAALLEGTVLGRSLSRLVAELRTRAVPNSWTSLFGAVAVACLVVLFATGLFLMFLYTPSSTVVEYRGSYVPLRGLEISRAFDSTLDISFEVRGGLLMRQAHHWAALVLPAALLLQMLALFFTGGFRKPRRGSWVLLFLLYVTALAGGWSGYALPDDVLSGTGLRIVEGILLGIPVVGTWASWLLFGGSFPGEVLAHLYPLHVALVPVALLLLVALRARLAYAHEPAQLPGPGRTEGNIVGIPLLPDAAVRAGGVVTLVAGILLALGATVTIDPVWLYGPASPGDASAGSQPDWYTGFLDGALRLVPPGWEFVLFGRTWTLAILAPLAVVTLFLALVAVYPYLEAWATGDRREHNLLQRPRNAPTRTGIGVAGILFYGALWGAGSADLLAVQFGLSIEGVVAFFQVALLAGPVLGFLVARAVARALRAKDRELLRHGLETGRIVRLPGGEYAEVHAPLDPAERARVADDGVVKPVRLRPDERGRLTAGRRLQARLSRIYAEPDPPAEPSPGGEVERARSGADA